MRLFYVMKALFMVCLGILRINAENLSLPNRIFKGQSANLNEFPHQVSIQVKRGLFGFFHFCGGSIVEASWVLTAGHCADLGANDRIVAGINNLKEKPSTRQVRQIVQIFPHPKYYTYNGMADYDIALIRVNEPFNVTSAAIGLIKLASFGHDEVGKYGQVAGWGLISKSNLVSDVLQKASLFIKHIDHCKLIVPFYSPKRMICAVGVNDEGVCPGDSGGPLVNKDTHHQIGIASFVIALKSRGICSTNIVFFTRVNAFHSFIDKTLKIKNFTHISLSASSIDHTFCNLFSVLILIMYKIL